MCTPAHIAAVGWGGFSALVYFFGRKLHQELKVPIGLIDASWGGTIAEAWVSESALGKMPDFPVQIARFKQAAAHLNAPTEEQTTSWLIANDFGTKVNWASAATDDKTWSRIAVPQVWENAGLPEMGGFDGIAWYRREVNVPSDWVGHDLTLKLGAIDDADTAYWNGVEVGHLEGFTTPREYTIPAAQVRAGRNVIAVRVVDNTGEGGLTGPAEMMRLERDVTHHISLGGVWKINIGKQVDLRLSPSNPNVVTVLYNGMIAPLVPYGLKGALWYQGESNAYRAAQYRRLLPTLINDWRQHFKTPLPFYIVQLADYMAPDDMPRNDEWPRLRDAQLHTAQTTKRSGLAVTIDIGDQNDLHPRDKQTVGLRLALNALAKDYAQRTQFSSPQLTLAKRRGSKFILTFKSAEGGLFLKGDANRVSAISGKDEKWVWATPQIEGNRILLNAPDVKEPIAARFGWSTMPRAFLYNLANLPASPFETKQW